MAANSSELLHDLFPIIRHYKDGRIERLWDRGYVAPSVDPETGVQSKDVNIAPEINLAARIFLPKNADPGKKYPLLVYYHGGGFVVESAFSRTYHKHLNTLVSEANVVAVSVEYRLAPEYPLPIAFEDSWLALKWVASQSSGQCQEEWIKQYADFNRVYLGGDSAGANIVSNLAVRLGTEKLEGNLNIIGAFLNCPYFAGKDVIGNEETHEVFPKRYIDRLWRYACPTTTGLDDPLINPDMDPKLSSFGCKRVLIFVAGKDVLRGRGLRYKETLIKSGWDGEIEVVDVEGEDHCFSVDFPTGEKGLEMLRRVASFLNDH